MKTQTQKSYRVVVETTRKFKDERQVMATSIEEAENYVQLPKAGENYIGDRNNISLVSEEITVTAFEQE